MEKTTILINPHTTEEFNFTTFFNQLKNFGSDTEKVRETLLKTIRIISTSIPEMGSEEEHAGIIENLWTLWDMFNFPVNEL